MKRYIITFFLCFIALLQVAAQKISGHVIDAATGEGAAFVNVFYEGTTTGVQTDLEGNFKINYRQKGTLKVSCVGYESTTMHVTENMKNEVVEIKLQPVDFSFAEAKVVGKKDKYSRKNNPAVELMKKVIAAKKFQSLESHDYYSYNSYQKINFAMADVTPKVFEEGKFKRMPFLKEHVERSPETDKLILPLILTETASKVIYRKSDDTKKEIVTGQREEGIQDIMSTSDMMTTLIEDFFKQVNIYEDRIFLLQNDFISPLSTKEAINFYRYFITDTTYVDGAKCIELQFTPNNPRDLGFSGDLYVLADSTYRVHKAVISVPMRSQVNFVENMKLVQEFTTLPTGEQQLSNDNMLVVMQIVGKFKLQARRITTHRDFAFEPIPDKDFNFRGPQRVMADAQMQNDEFWDDQRTEELTQSESRIGQFVDRVLNIKGLKPVVWLIKTLVNGYVETSMDPKKGSKVDIGPANTWVSYNQVDGLRLRTSVLTTANLHPNWFLLAYGAYGFKDQRFKGKGEVTYSFNKKKYLPLEYPKHDITVSGMYDLMIPSDVYLPTDKDNFTNLLKWSPVDHMMYNTNFKIVYDHEYAYGLRLMFKATHDEMEAAHNLFFQAPKDGMHLTDANGNYTTRPYMLADFVSPTTKMPDIDAWRAHNRAKMTTTGFTAFLSYEPGVDYINTKDSRIRVNKEAPIYSVSHTFGIEGLWSDYTYNLTEFSFRKRWWVGSWGKLDIRVNAGIQWNKVPFPLLCQPMANLSYIRHDNMFSLIKNMEFQNDRYASFQMQWDLNGKFFNRIPLINRLKWREYFGVNCLWGYLSDKNNPYSVNNRNDNSIFYFPSRWKNGAYQQQTMLMDPKKPYVEVFVGIHNIFKVLFIQYVHRLTYVEGPESIYGATDKWGIRFMMRVGF